MGGEVNRLIMVTGGVRSGKSAFAERYAARLAGGAPGAGVVYVATGRIWDDEMAARVARHRAQRPGSWPTVEAPLHLATALDVAPAAGAGVALVDSLDFWVSNRLLEAQPVAGEGLDGQSIAALEGTLVEEVEGIARRWGSREGHLILVTAEAGMGVVPPYPLGRAFRDLLGRVNATLAGAAGEVFLLVAGLPVDVKRLSRETVRALGQPGGD